MKILMIAGDFTEDYELMVPYQALQVVGLEVDVVCPDKNKGDIVKTAIHDFEGYQTYTEKVGHNFILNVSFQNIKLHEYDGLFITGGRSPEYLRMDSRIIDIVHYFMDLEKPIASICHGVQILTAADVIRGLDVTGYYSLEPEVKSAGGNFIKKEAHEAVICRNLVTSPAWPGNIEILKGFLKLLKRQN